MEGIFFQISLILLIVLAVTFFMRILRQPLIIGYILSGIIAGPFFLDLLKDNTAYSIFADLGIALLLFLVGLSLSPKVIKEVGKISLITGVGQVIFTSLVGYFIARGLGFDVTTAVYIAIALTFSSTIIIMKLLSDKDALDKLYGKISTGFLLVQDFIAIVILIVVSSFSNGGAVSDVIVSTLIKTGIILALFIPVSHYLLPKLSNFFARSQELLFVFALAWGLGIASMFFNAGLSVEVGALIAGVMLSMSPYSYEISSRLKPLRDFFIISFFILLGSQMVFGETSNLIVPAIIFSLFILIGNPLIVMILMGIFGYSKNTGFKAGLTVAQISEFSLILIALGVKVGHLSNDILAFVTLIGLATIAGSTYMIMFSDKIYFHISKYLSIFEKKKLKEVKNIEKHSEYLLFGENRTGFAIMNTFTKMKKRYSVIDFNPKRVATLKKKGINCIYGDISDAYFLSGLKIEKSKLIVSTIPEMEVNLMVLNKVREVNKKVIIIVTARNASEAFELYKAGANYVILPNLVGGEYAAKIIKRAQVNKKMYEQEKKKQIKKLRKMVGKK